MLQAIDREPAVIATKQLEMCDKAIRQLPREALQLAPDQLPFIVGAFSDRVKLGAIVAEIFQGHSPSYKTVFTFDAPGAPDDSRSSNWTAVQSRYEGSIRSSL